MTRRIFVFRIFLGACPYEPRGRRGIHVGHLPPLENGGKTTDPASTSSSLCQRIAVKRGVGAGREKLWSQLQKWSP